jgi:hypothetical protein
MCLAACQTAPAAAGQASLRYPFGAHGRRTGWIQCPAWRIGKRKVCDGQGRYVMGKEGM